MRKLKFFLAAALAAFLFFVGNGAHLTAYAEAHRMDAVSAWTSSDF